jgi:hypothetical protein
MFRKCGLSLAAFAAIGFSLAMSSSAIAFHGGLFHRYHGSSGGSYGGSSTSCGCDCGSSGEASEGNHEDNSEHRAVSDRDERGSRDVHRDANGVTVEERDRERHHDADRNRDGDKKHDEDMKRAERKDKDKDKGKEKDNEKNEEAKK